MKIFSLHFIQRFDELLHLRLQASDSKLEDAVDTQSLITVSEPCLTLLYGVWVDFSDRLVLDARLQRTLLYHFIKVKYRLVVTISWIEFLRKVIHAFLVVRSESADLLQHAFILTSDLAISLNECVTLLDANRRFSEFRINLIQILGPALELSHRIAPHQFALEVVLRLLLLTD